MRTRPEWWLAALEAAFALPLVKSMLWVRGYQRTRDWLSRRAGARTRLEPRPPQAVQTIASAVTAIAGVHPLPTVCLARSLVIWWLCRRRGHAVDLVMGVREPEEGRLPAHAWVEYVGVPLNDSPDVRQRYQVLTID